MARLLLSVAFATIVAASECPTYFRAVNSYKPSSTGARSVDVYVNDVRFKTVSFREVTEYMVIPSGRTTIGIRAAGASASAPFLEWASFNVAAGKFYTAGFLGNIPGPSGQVVYSRVPIIVNEDVRLQPNPGRFRGLWYRWSETNLVIDFRAVRGDPRPAGGVINATDAGRISNLAPKTVIPIFELPEGTYSFYPTGVDSRAPLANPRLTATGGFVAVRNLTTVDGHLYDFFATGDTLVNSHPFNLQVGFTDTVVNYDATSGCTILPGYTN